MLILLLLAGALSWYLTRGASRWSPAARRIVDRISPWTRRLHLWVISAPASTCYVAVFSASTLIARTSPPRLIDVVTQLSSTNLKRLSERPIHVLVTSALWVADRGFGLSGYILVFLTVVAWAERRYGTPRILLVAGAGHVVGSLLTALAESQAIRSGRAPAALAQTTDVGVSYIMVAGCAAAVLVLPKGWRAVGAAVLAAALLLPLLVHRTVWDLGHVLAASCGLAMGALLLLAAPARSHPSITRLAPACPLPLPGTHQGMTQQEHRPGVGETAGLPGENAAPQTAELTDDERASTVAMSEVAPPDDGEPGSADPT